MSVFSAATNHSNRIRAQSNANTAANLANIRKDLIPLTDDDIAVLKTHFLNHNIGAADSSALTNMFTAPLNRYFINIADFKTKIDIDEVSNPEAFDYATEWFTRKYENRRGTGQENPKKCSRSKRRCKSTRRKCKCRTGKRRKSTRNIEKYRTRNYKS